MANQFDPAAEGLREKLVSELGFRVDPDEKKSLIKDISPNYGMVFYHDEEYPLSFGFYHYNDKNFAPEQKKWLSKDVFDRWEFSENFGDFCEWGDRWICKKFTGNRRQGWKDTEIINFLFSSYQWLEQTVKYLGIT
jgi:hypothetical protein